MAGLWCVGLVHTGARRMIDTSFSYNSYLILAYQNGNKYFLVPHTYSFLPHCNYTIYSYFPSIKDQNYRKYHELSISNIVLLIDNDKSNVTC